MTIMTDEATPKQKRKRVLHPIELDITATADWQLVHIRTVAQWTQLAQGTIYNKIRDGEFPDHEEKENPGDRNVWRAGVVKTWIKSGMPAALAWRAAYAASSISGGADSAG